MENLKEHIKLHPADALAKALDRVSILLVAVGQLFEANDESFLGGNTFVAHAISTSTTLVADAKTALDELHSNCDLTLLDNIGDNETVIEMSLADKTSVDVIPTAQAISVENEVAAKTAASQQEEKVAKTYLELLRKLTAAEVFAAEQQALSVPGAPAQLLPLLRSLREDIEKIHAAA